MSLRKDAVLGRVWLFGLLALIGLVDVGQAEPRGEIALQGSFSDVFDRQNDHYQGGPGFNIFGTYYLSRSFDVRADFGARFLEGENFALNSDKPSPDLRSRYGERTGDLRVMPFTVDLVYRFEDISKGRFWIPFFAAGFGFYDMEATFLPPDPKSSHHDDSDGSGLPLSGGDEFEDDFEEGRKQNIFDFGWNAKAGVNLHRTSQLFINLEAGAHFINTRRRWTPMYDVSIGVGTTLPLPSP